MISADAKLLTLLYFFSSIVTFLPAATLWIPYVWSSMHMKHVLNSIDLYIGKAWHKDSRKKEYRFGKIQIWWKTYFFLHTKQNGEKCIIMLNYKRNMYVYTYLWYMCCCLLYLSRRKLMVFNAQMAEKFCCLNTIFPHSSSRKLFFCSFKLETKTLYH